MITGSASSKHEGLFHPTMEQLRLAESASGFGTFEVDLVERHWRISPQVLVLFGAMPDSDLAFDELTKLIFFDDLPKLHGAVAAAAAHAEGCYAEFRVDLPTGVRWLGCRGQTLVEEGSRRLSGSFFDITDRKALDVRLLQLTETLEARVLDLRQSQEHYQTLFEAIPYAVVVTDNESLRLLAVNDAATRQYGWSRAEMLSKTIDVFYLPEDLTDATARRSSFSTEKATFVRGLRHRRKDGTLISVEKAVRLIEYDGRPAAVSIITDVTERLSVEEQLRQAQKMEAVGQLTGGVAHDFNNLLMVIMANVDALDEEVDLVPEVRDRLKGISAAADRAAELTRQLLAFSRKQALRPEAIDVNDLVAATGKLLRRSLGEHIEIESLLVDDLWIAEVDRAQLESALVNLSINARDAMPGGGRLLIETANVVLDEDYASHNDEVAVGDYVMLAVTDTGQGIPAKILGKVFEPFFTTKAIGKGSGLGLSMIYGFIKQSKGHIKIYSEVDRGTTVKLYLPRSTAGRQIPEAGVKPAMARGTERFLVVEDDELVRASVVGQLRSLGYEVTEAADGASGLAAFESSPVPYDLLLTDVIMPGAVSGKALADEVGRRWPTTKVVFMSGYTENAIIHHGRLDADVLLISKPFRKADLAKMMRQALDQRRS